MVSIDGYRKFLSSFSGKRLNKFSMQMALKSNYGSVAVLVKYALSRGHIRKSGINGRSDLYITTKKGKQLEKLL